MLLYGQCGAVLASSSDKPCYLHVNQQSLADMCTKLIFHSVKSSTQLYVGVMKRCKRIESRCDYLLGVWNVTVCDIRVHEIDVRNMQYIVYYYVYAIEAP